MLRSAPIRLPLPAGAPLRQALEWFAANRPVLAAPTPAPGRWTFLRALVAGRPGSDRVYRVLRGDPVGAMFIAGGGVRRGGGVEHGFRVASVVPRDLALTTRTPAVPRKPCPGRG